MITLREMVDEGFVEIAIDSKNGGIYGGRFSYSTDGGKNYQPCAIYLAVDTDTMLDINCDLWNMGIYEGKVQLNGRDEKIYWHLFKNKIHTHRGPVRIRCDVMKETGTQVLEMDIDLVPVTTVFVNDWEPLGVWKVDNGSLTLEKELKGKAIEPYNIRPGLKGDYDVFVGLGPGMHHSVLKASNEPNRYPFTGPKFRRGFTHKVLKEIPWKTLRLETDTVISMELIPHAVQHPEIYPFGKVEYVKFVPVKKPVKKTVSKWNDKKLALYFEPYSWAYLYGLQDKWRVREALELLKEMGADEIHNQMLRFGCKTNHWSKVAEPIYGMTKGDDETFSAGPEEMAKSLDVLRESIDLCRELGIKHYANAGLTICYAGDALEDKFSREHPEFRTDNMLRYKFPETRAYAAAIVKEFIDWGSDGVSIDCMRYPWHNTEEELNLFFDAICEVIDKKVPLTVRMPCEDVVYYRVAERLAKSGRLQCIIPANDSQSVKLSLKPFLRFKEFGCKVYGRVEAWNCGLWWDSQAGFSSLLNNPKAIKQDIADFFDQGADGIFVYQADMFLSDAVNRLSPDWRQWK